MTVPLHPIYLPFSVDQMAQHFAPVKAHGAGHRHIRYYLRSLERARLHAEAVARGAVPTPSQLRSGRQLEKDERFWIAAALMHFFHAESVTERAGRFGQLLDRAGLKPPSDIPAWTQALTGPLHLYFEVSLPSPQLYTQWLRPRLDDRMPIPYVREAAAQRLEGHSHIDAMLLASDTGVAMIIEAKVLADLSTDVTFDMARNQLARTIDVMLEANPNLRNPLSSRRPDRSYVVLLTPELAHDREGSNPIAKSRLYGWLMPAYQDTKGSLLGAHLPYRSPEELQGVPERLGWASWEDCNAVLSGACTWPTAAEHRVGRMSG